MRGSSPSLLRGRWFHCREWALEKLKKCLEARNSPNGTQSSASTPPGILVTGGPGTGKTAFCTEVVWPQSEAGRAAELAPRCLAWHYCQQEDAGSVEVWRFVLALVEQLRESPLLPPSYSHMLASPSLAATLEPLHCQRDPDDTFKRAVLEPLLSLASPAQSVCIVIDSLDSGCSGLVGVGTGMTPGSVTNQSSSIAELLLRHLQLLPSWILLVCSARRQNKAVCKMFSELLFICVVYSSMFKCI
uniref:Orc1-like AAA ATPase domain-containing protein n=1 Tax=Electrophorus electricus TaxID=8005 RepID=A0A4W4HGR3_ELEEL